MVDGSTTSPTEGSFVLLRRAVMAATAFAVPTAGVTAFDASPDEQRSDPDRNEPSVAIERQSASSDERDAGTELVVERRHTTVDAPGAPERRVAVGSPPSIHVPTTASATSTTTLEAPNADPTTTASSLDAAPSTNAPTSASKETTVPPTATLTELALPTPTTPTTTPVQTLQPSGSTEAVAALVAGETPVVTYIDIVIHPGRSTTSAPAPEPANRYEELGFAALAEISYPWQELLPEWKIVFSPGRADVYGYTYTDRQEIEIFVRMGQTPELLAHVVAHELGHAVDVTLNNSEERQEWQQLRQIGDSPWWPGNGASDFSTGAGDFAEAFAAWQVGDTNFRSRIAGTPNAAELQLLARLSSN